MLVTAHKVGDGNWVILSLLQLRVHVHYYMVHGVQCFYQEMLQKFNY